MEPENPSQHLKFAESDTPVQKTVIGAFLDIYNAYYRATRGVDLDRLLAEMVLTARALREIGEVDESYCEALQKLCTELSESLTAVGRFAAMTLHAMNQKRGGAPSGLDEQWPDLVSENEQ